MESSAYIKAKKYTTILFFVFFFVVLFYSVTIYVYEYAYANDFIQDAQENRKSVKLWFMFYIFLVLLLSVQ